MEIHSFLTLLLYKTLTIQGMNNNIYLSPNVKNKITGSFTIKKPDLYDQNLQCNLFLFLSIVHGNQQLNRSFIQRCQNKDYFLQLFDTQQYSILLTKVLQIVNQYFTENSSNIEERINQNKSWYSTEQKPQIIQKQACSADKFQSMIKKIITNDLDPLKSMINKVQEQNFNQSPTIQKLMSSTSIPSKLSQKLMKTNYLKDQLKEKITKLAMENSYSCQYKLVKTDNESQHICKSQQKEVQTIDLSEKDYQVKPNRISFGQQPIFVNQLQEDQIIETSKSSKNQKNQANLIECSPTFLHNQFSDLAIQTNDELIYYQKNDKTHEQQISNENSIDQKLNHSHRRFDGTFGKVRSKDIRNRQKSNSISESVSPQKSARNNCEIISIDQVQRKRKISNNSSINRNYNILTNEQLQ